MSTETPVVLAFLSQSKLFLQHGNAPAEPIDSAFVGERQNRADRNRERNEWRQQSMGWNLNPMSRLGATQQPVDRPPVFTGVSRGPDGFATYTLNTDHVGGLFEYELTTGYERRLYHHQNFRAADLQRHPVDGRLAMTIRDPSGLSHLGVAEAEGRKLSQITEGDVRDEAPSWVSSDTVVYQSAGVARNQHGHLLGAGPYAIHRLNVVTGDIETLVENDNTDYLLPRQQPDGTLFFIRRPYEGFRPKVSLLKAAADVVFFPFRLIRAFIHFFNFFSLMFSKKPLLTASGPPREDVDVRHMILWGRVLDAQKMLERGSDAPLAPKEWQLIRRDPTGDERVIASSVLCYDVASDGMVFVSDGTHIRRVNGDQNEVMAKHAMVERICILAG